MASGKAVGLSHMKPTRRSFGCCPTAVSGQATTLLSKVMNSRRFIVTLDVQDEHSIGSNWHVERVHGRRVMSALGQKKDMCGAKRHVCFTPDSDRESGHRPGKTSRPHHQACAVRVL